MHLTCVVVSSPLEGLLVADFSRVLAAPLATMTLADLGATVIKIERPGAGDDTRAWGPPWTATSSSYFSAANRSKRSIQLDLDDANDLRFARQLARRADVLVENFARGAMERRGLGYDNIRKQNPRIIYASLSGFGDRGGAGLHGYDLLVQALGGLMSISGEPGEPTKVGTAVVDVLAGKDLTIGVQAALIERHASGLGQHVKVNLLSSLLAALANQGSSFLTTGVPPAAMGNKHPSIAPYETFRVHDDHIVIAVGNDAQFSRLAVTLGLSSLLTDERFATNSQRVAYRTSLVSAIERALTEADVDTWVSRLVAVDVPAGRVGSVADGFALAARLGLDPVVEVGSGEPPQVRSPIELSRTPIAAYDAPPRLGEHDREVRRWLNQEEQE